MIYIVVSDDIVSSFIESDIKPVLTNDYLVLEGDKYDVSNIKEGYIYNRKKDTFIFAERTFSNVETPTVQPTLDDVQMQILLNTEYLVVMSELTTI